MEAEISQTRIPFKLGDGEIHAVVHQLGSTRPTMLNVHDDEDTSVAAGLANIKEFGGRVIELAHSGARLITFTLAGAEYSFDPNRIFSDAGITETLKKKSVYSPAAHAEIKKFARAYLEKFALDREPAIIALHNTSDGIFSVESFAPQGYLGSNSTAVHINPKRNIFDFYYVTEKRFFDFFKQRDFNVVLQDNEAVTDDGSLSVHFARLGIPYINVEAEMGRLPEQIEMLKAAREILREIELG